MGPRDTLVSDVESAARHAHEAGDLALAATLALRAYGGEVLGYLVATLRDESDADEVFSTVAEDLWRGIGGFAWRSSLRTWLYCLARHAAARHRRAPAARRDRNLPLSEAEHVAEHVRSRTLPFLRTEVKDRFAELRRSLDPDDQDLLVLRVDRGLEWLDVARVFAGDDADDEALRRESARLRKRFQTVKDEVRERARGAGLLEG